MAFHGLINIVPTQHSFNIIQIKYNYYTYNENCKIINFF